MLAILINLVLSIGAYLNRKLTGLGAITASIVGYLYVLFGGWPAWFLLIFFFGASIIISLIKKTLALNHDDNSLTQTEVSKGRSAKQVLANSILGIGCLAGYYYQGNPLWWVLMAASIANSSADTWASEIGIISSKSPLYLVGGQEVAPGLSGGVSILGNLASLGGAFYIASLAGLLTNFGISFSAFLLIFLSGCLCSIIDSLMGQFLQAIYQDDQTQVLYESPGPDRHLIRGYPWMTNNLVNLLSNLLVLGLDFLLMFTFFLLKIA